ncbi:hypothetical protein D478_18824 [Brevibacillus agri BAB-2500]|nr:hypothetical protein D478_18824 [Brevibacillus agri BAB-2500]
MLLVQSWQIINDRLINAFAVQFSKSIFINQSLKGDFSILSHHALFCKRFFNHFAVLSSDKI